MSEAVEHGTAYLSTISTLSRVLRAVLDRDPRLARVELAGVAGKLYDLDAVCVLVGGVVADNDRWPGLPHLASRLQSIPRSSPTRPHHAASGSSPTRDSHHSSASAS